MKLKWIILTVWCLQTVASAANGALKTRNVILVMSDGVRWQEVFKGAEPALISKLQGVKDLEATRKEFFRDNPQARREALMPFLHTVIAKQGQLYGNQSLGSVAHVTNGKNFSYPGYNETLSGFADDRIDSNAKLDNRNVTVLEWLNGKPQYRDRVAAFGTWDVFPSILNRNRAKFHIIAGFEPVGPGIDPFEKSMNERIKKTPRTFESVILDEFHFEASMDYLRKKKPRVLFIGYGETDEWAHAGRYDAYLQALRKVDSYLQELWRTLQSLPEYKDSTTLLFTTDHGRGSGPVEWRDHGDKTDGSENIWLAAMGPDTPKLGERTQIAPVTQSQVAATMAALLGEDFKASSRRIAPAIRDVLPK